MSCIKPALTENCERFPAQFYFVSILQFFYLTFFVGSKDIGSIINDCKSVKL